MIDRWGENIFYFNLVFPESVNLLSRSKCLEMQNHPETWDPLVQRCGSGPINTDPDPGSDTWKKRIRFHLEMSLEPRHYDYFFYTYFNIIFLKNIYQEYLQKFPVIFSHVFPVIAIFNTLSLPIPTMHQVLLYTVQSSSAQFNLLYSTYIPVLLQTGDFM